MPTKNTDEAAALIVKLYKKTFEGKRNGPYKITRDQLRRLAGRKNLQNTIVYEISAIISDDGLFLIDNDDEFYIVHIDVLDQYRNVPDEIIDDLL